MADEPLRVAVLGTGAIAQIVHLPILSKLPGVEVAALCDVDESKAGAIASRFAIPEVLHDDETVFERDDIDAVIVCTPSHAHEEQVGAALQAGKHVLVERPIALTARGAEKVVAAAEEAGRVLMIALNNRYRPDILAIKPFIDGGELGRIISIKAGWLNRKTRIVRPTWRHHSETAGGGALMDLGVQTLDLCMWLLDYPEVDRVVAATHPGEGMEVEDSATAVFTLADGAVVSIEVSWSLVADRDHHYVQLLAENGSASVRPLAVYKEMELGHMDVTPETSPDRENPYTASYRKELVQFFEAARGAHDVELPTEQVRLMHLIERAYQSARKGKEVKA